jgi:serine/threonine protein kinase
VYFCREQWAQLTPEARELVSRMLEPNPAERISAEEALAHPWFQRLLGYTPRPSGVLSTGNNVVEFQRQQAVDAAATAAGGAEPWRAPAPMALSGRSTSAVLDELLATLSPGRKAPVDRMSLSVAVS